MRNVKLGELSCKDAARVRQLKQFTGGRHEDSACPDRWSAQSVDAMPKQRPKATAPTVRRIWINATMRAVPPRSVPIVPPVTPTVREVKAGLGDRRDRCTGSQQIIWMDDTHHEIGGRERSEG